jgi:hypothetical protein
MRKLIAVLAVTIMFFGLTIALKADDSTANTGNTLNSMAAPTMVATAVSTPALMTFNNGATTVGGHLKMELFDWADGVRTTDVSGVKTKTGSTEYSGAGSNSIWLYISHQLSDVFSIEVEPEFDASTSATPKLGYKIGAQIKDSAESLLGFDRALAKYTTPGDIEISGGIIKPIFTMDYGEELFWQEEYNGSRFAANPYLGEADAAGVEVYKAFTLGDASLPVWLYAINPSSSNLGSVNNQPAGMIHVEPEYGMFKLSGSYQAGTWDANKQDAYQRTSGGIVFNWQGLQLRGEYASGRWNNQISMGNDALSQGWYAKAIYKVTPWLKLVYNYNVAYMNFETFFDNFLSPIDGGPEKYITHTLTFDINMTDSSILMLQIDYAYQWAKTSGEDALTFIRPTLAYRITF